MGGREYSAERRLAHECSPDLQVAMGKSKSKGKRQSAKGKSETPRSGFAFPCYLLSLKLTVPGI